LNSECGIEGIEIVNLRVLEFSLLNQNPNSPLRFSTPIRIQNVV
jgi:hypothetical protein